MSCNGEEQSQVRMILIGGGFKENQTGAVHIFVFYYFSDSAMACAVVVGFFCFF